MYQSSADCVVMMRRMQNTYLEVARSHEGFVLWQFQRMASAKLSKSSSAPGWDSMEYYRSHRCVANLETMAVFHFREKHIG